jgi:hypothetical protein
MNKAKEYCKSLNKEYQWKVIHLCDGEPIYQYSFNGKSFWSFEIPNMNNITINWSMINNGTE